MSPLRDARDIEEERHIRDAIRRVQRRVITYSVVAAGFVSLFIGHAFETEAANNQANRSRQNCGFLNDRIKAAAIRDQNQSDQVLGNRSKNLPPADFSKPPYKAFSAFKSLIIAQAVQQRRDALSAFKGLNDCNKVFPKQKTWIFF